MNTITDQLARALDLLASSIVSHACDIMNVDDYDDLAELRDARRTQALILRDALNEDQQQLSDENMTYLNSKIEEYLESIKL